MNSGFSKKANDKKWEWGALALLLLVYFLIQLPSLFNVPYELYADWRQTDTYSIAVNFVQYGMNPLAPQFNYDGTGDIFVQLELQIVPYISALIFSLIGEMTPFVPRVLGLFCFLGSAIFLYRICRKFIGTVPSLMAVSIYLAMPISLMYSRAIMPESCALFFYCGAVCFLLDWYEQEKSAHIWLSAFFMAFAIMQKIPVAFAGLLVLFVFLWKRGAGCFKMREFWGYGVIALGLPGAYYAYSSVKATMSYVDGIATKHIFSSKIFELFSAETIGFFRDSLPAWLGIAVIVAALVGFCFCFNGKNKPLAVWAIAFFLETITIVAVIKFDYYLVFLAPVLAILAGVAVDRLWNFRLALGVLAFVLILSASLYRSVPCYREKVQEHTMVGAIARSIQEVSDPDDVIAVGVSSPTLINAANRHGYRANIKYHEHIPVGPGPETDYYIQQGVSCFVAPFGQVTGDTDGSYMKYLEDNFPVLLENEYCIIFNLEETK